MNDASTTGSELIGWQTLLADLSLILFMVTAASMPASHAKPNPRLPCNTALGEPLAVWRAGGSQSLVQWLASEQPDARQQLTSACAAASAVASAPPR